MPLSLLPASVPTCSPTDLDLLLAARVALPAWLSHGQRWDLAEAAGLWDPSLPKDFTRTFSDGEYAHKYYSGRRMWGAWRLASPAFVGASLSPEYGDLKADAPYPFSVPVERKLGVADVLSIHRDWYAGTPYDLARQGGQPLAGGPGGSPDRYGGCAAGDANCTALGWGAWERPIGLYRTSDTVLLQSRGWLPDAVGGTVWFGPHAAHGTVFVPLACGMLRAAPEYSTAWQGDGPAAQRRANGGFWASRAVLNLAQLRFDRALPVVQAAQAAWEREGIAVQARAGAAFLAATAGTGPAAGALEALTAAHLAHAASAVRAWWELSDELLFAFSDGYFNRWEPSDNDTTGSAPSFVSSTIGYPSWWLEQVGYQNGPPPVS